MDTAYIFPDEDSPFALMMRREGEVVEFHFGDTPLGRSGPWGDLGDGILAGSQVGAKIIEGDEKTALEWQGGCLTFDTDEFSTNLANLVD